MAPRSTPRTCTVHGAVHKLGPADRQSASSLARSTTVYKANHVRYASRTAVRPNTSLLFSCGIMSRSLLVYLVKSKNSVFRKIRIKSLRIGNTKPIVPDSFRTFTCNIDPNLSWEVSGREGMNKWIPITENAASGFLYTVAEPDPSSPWLIEMDCQNELESMNAVASFSLSYSHEEDQGIVCLPLKDSGTARDDEIYLCYLFTHDYIPPEIGDKKPLSMHLKPVQLHSIESFWPVNPPLLIGHAGAGVKRCFYGTGLEWPENTICGFRRAEQVGLSMVECDATVTRDYRTVVLHHNFTVGFRQIKPKEGFQEPTFVLEHAPDGPVDERTKNLIIHYSLPELRALLGMSSPNGQLDLQSNGKSNNYHPPPMNPSDPIPDMTGPEGQPFPELADVFHHTSTQLGFNIEMKYPSETLMGRILSVFDSGKAVSAKVAGPHTYFAKINKFCDTILDTVWTHAGSRNIVLSSFNADVCTALRLKQSQFPVMFITRGGVKSGSYPADIRHVDVRHSSLPVAAWWAKFMDFAGVVTVGDLFGSDMSSYPIDRNESMRLAADLEQKRLACFVYGMGVSEMEFVRQAYEYGLSGLIIDRIDEFMTSFRQFYPTRSKT
ncbi:unnamed protein product [Calicophoron daubneyi]|uniref:GP-PDE domain-containing protein n=1 Tax=Calicophoron daubneyi TaxID=300641 RepID=A0AAV2TS57_CALDB